MCDVSLSMGALCDVEGRMSGYVRGSPLCDVSPCGRPCVTFRAPPISPLWDV